LYKTFDEMISLAKHFTTDTSYQGSVATLH